MKDQARCRVVMCLPAARQQGSNQRQKPAALNRNVCLSADRTAQQLPVLDRTSENQFCRDVCSQYDDVDDDGKQMLLMRLLLLLVQMLVERPDERRAMARERERSALS